MPVIARCDVCGREEPCRYTNDDEGNRAPRAGIVPRRWFLFQDGSGWKLGCSEKCRAVLAKTFVRSDFSRACNSAAAGRSRRNVPKLDLPLSALAGGRIRDRRLAAGLTQSALARAIGIAPGYLSSIENGGQRINLEILDKAACHLGVKPEDLTR